MRVKLSGEVWVECDERKEKEGEKWLVERWIGEVGCDPWSLW